MGIFDKVKSLAYLMAVENKMKRFSYSITADKKENVFIITVFIFKIGLDSNIYHLSGRILLKCSPFFLYDITGTELIST